MNIEKYLNMLDKDIPTNFLEPNIEKEVMKHLNKKVYHIFKPYIDSEKNIIYKNNLPNVILYEIKSKIILRHQDILGTLFSLNIDTSLFGDILVIDNKYYFYTLEKYRFFFETNLLKIKNSNIELTLKELDTLKNYTRDYESIKLIVPSNRIDIIIARLIKTNREKVKDMIKDKLILINYEILKNNSYKLKNSDIFSVRKYGKFKFKEITDYTKKNHLIVEILKYK